MPGLIPAPVIALLLSSISIAHARDSFAARDEAVTPPRWQSATVAYSAKANEGRPWQMNS